MGPREPDALTRRPFRGRRVERGVGRPPRDRRPPERRRRPRRRRTSAARPRALRRGRRSAKRAFAGDELPVRADRPGGRQPGVTTRRGFPARHAQTATATMMNSATPPDRDDVERRRAIDARRALCRREATFERRDETRDADRRSPITRAIRGWRRTSPGTRLDGSRIDNNHHPPYPTRHTRSRRPVGPSALEGTKDAPAAR